MFALPALESNSPWLHCYSVVSIGKVCLTSRARPAESRFDGHFGRKELDNYFVDFVPVGMAFESKRRFVW